MVQWTGLGKRLILASLNFSQYVMQYQRNNLFFFVYVPPSSGPPDAASFMDGADDKRFARFRAIDKDGICLVGEPLDNGSVMVNKGQYLLFDFFLSRQR